MNYQRVQAKVTLEVSVGADAFFAQLMKWPDIMGWPNPPVALSKVELKAGHKVGQLPCTRLCYIDKSKLPPGVGPNDVPEYVAETLLAFDNTTRTCLYLLEGEGPLGMRNYIATTEVDEVKPGVARVTCTGRVDLPEGAPPEAIQGMLTETYKRGVIGGTAHLAGGKVL